MAKNVLKTKRLCINLLEPEGDAAFILELVNTKEWLSNIGDKGVTDLISAGEYILSGPVASYKSHGYGLYLLKLKTRGESIGICGLVNRPQLPQPDIGFALHPRFTGFGYAFEAAKAIKEYAKVKLGIHKILGITSSENEPSIKLLKKLGLKLDGDIYLSPKEQKLLLFST